MSELQVVESQVSKASLLSSLEDLLKTSFKTIDRRVANPKETLELPIEIQASILKLQNILELVKQIVPSDDPDMKKAALNVYGLERRFKLVERLIGSSVVTATPAGFRHGANAPVPKAIKVRNCYPSPFLLEEKKTFNKAS